MSYGSGRSDELRIRSGVVSCANKVSAPIVDGNGTATHVGIPNCSKGRRVMNTTFVVKAPRPSNKLLLAFLRSRWWKSRLENILVLASATTEQAFRTDRYCSSGQHNGTAFHSTTRLYKRSQVSDTISPTTTQYPFTAASAISPPFRIPRLPNQIIIHGRSRASACYPGDCILRDHLGNNHRRHLEDIP